MTDNEAPRLTTKDLEKAIEKLKKNGVGQNGCQVVLDANTVYQIMIENERLRRKPDPHTGLVPCGCGGLGLYEGAYLDEEVPSSYRVCLSCSECGISTAEYEYEQEAMRAWNTAMGQKGGAE